jgi:hypothetical protein
MEGGILMAQHGNNGVEYLLVLGWRGNTEFEKSRFRLLDHEMKIW